MDAKRGSETSINLSVFSPLTGLNNLDHFFTQHFDFHEQVCFCINLENTILDRTIAHKISLYIKNSYKSLGPFMVSPRNSFG